MLCSSIFVAVEPEGEGSAMKQLMTSAICAIGLLSACSPKGDGEKAGNSTAFVHNAAAPIVSETPTKPHPPITVTRKDEALNFVYSWPSAAASIPALNAWLNRHADDQYNRAHRSAADDAKAMKRDGFPYRMHEFQQKWTALADTPGVLVLQSDGYEYTGGAHGMPFTSALIWDRAKGARLGTGDVIDLPRFAMLATSRYCDELNRQRKEKRGLAVKPDSTDPFDACPDMTKQQVFPISAKGKALDTVRIVIGPYEAGPYAEGDYTIDLPMDAVLRPAIKPAYRAWFTGTP
jgi:hypothetical protein